MWNSFMTDNATSTMHNLHTKKGATIHQLCLGEGARKVAAKIGKCKEKVMSMFEKTEDEYNDLISKKNIIKGFRRDGSDVWEEADESVELYDEENDNLVGDTNITVMDGVESDEELKVPPTQLHVDATSDTEIEADSDGVWSVGCGKLYFKSNYIYNKQWKNTMIILASWHVL
ncbi:hypothetical protein Tco_0894058 [Tanacetum coccineum]|uniref:Uncharacterized protein n=1 Tax=Tanacetum coccineum TaxID=301880 RepID=A0ABQ5CDY8_9ASTR